MATVHIERPAYSDQSFRDAFSREEDNSFKLRWQYRYKQKLASCSGRRSWTDHLRALFPILTWLPLFDVRHHLLGEILAGLTIGFVNVPQGMAFAHLAGLEAYFGLYVAFFPVIVYIFMGSCRHQSWGGFGVTAIMSGDAVIRIMNTRMCPPPDSPTSTPVPDDIIDIALEVSVTIALLVGLIQIIMGVLRMGFISVYLSRPLIQGLSTGAAFHVATSQIPVILFIGMDERPHGVFSLFKIWKMVLSSLASIHWATLLVSLAAFILLLIMAYANHKLKGKLPVPIPMDMIVVVLITIISFAFNIHQNFEVELVGDIKTGFPTPMVPSFHLFPDVVLDAIAIALVTYVVNISLGKTIAERHGYEIDDNQELLASGFASSLSSFFSCYVSGPSLSRIWIVEKAGGRFQLTSAVGCVFTLIMILALGRFLEPLPKAVLGVVLIFSLKGMIAQLSVLPRLYQQSKWDFAIWIVTFSAVLLLGVATGLFASLVFSFFAVSLRVQFPVYTVEGKIEGAELFVDSEKFKTEVNRRYTVFHMKTSLCFLNALNFRSRLKALVQHEAADKTEVPAPDHPGDVQLPTPSQSAVVVVNTADGVSQDEPNNTGQSAIMQSIKSHTSLTPGTDERPQMMVILVNCASFSFVDHDGARVLASTIRECREGGATVLLAACTESVHRFLLQSGYFEDLTDIFYPSLIDAYISVQ